MLAHRVIPTLLTRGRTLVKGEHFNAWRSVGVTAQAIQVHQARGCDEILLLDIGATPEGRGPDLGLVRELAEMCFSPLTVGGGVRSVEDVRALLRAGADKVAICSAGLKVIEEASSRFGKQAIVGVMDVKNDHVYSHCGTQPINGREGHCWASGWPCNLMLAGAGEILVTSIEREGTMTGYDLDLVRHVASMTDIPVIAHGGCSGPADMLAAINAGASACAAGALFQFSDITPKECSRYLAEHGIEART